MGQPWGRPTLSTPPPSAPQRISSPGAWLSHSIYSVLSPTPTIITSPRDDPPDLHCANPCPPTLFPAPPHYIPTAYGTIFTTELGPPTGPKLILFTGISTSSAIFHPLALDLSRTHRLLLFDLYGRGYSDAPTHVRFDERLFITQALYAIMGSSLHWEKFSILGYSFGGSLAVAFAEFFPERVEKLVLIAPCGVADTKLLPLGQRLSRMGLVPVWLEKWAAKRRSKVVGKLYERKEQGRSGLSMAALVNWQTKNHKGYFESFVRSWREGGMFEQEERWARVSRLGIETAVLLGGRDAVLPITLAGKMRGLLGGDRVKVEVLENGEHDMVTMMPKEVAGFVKGIWQHSLADSAVVEGITEDKEEGNLEVDSVIYAEAAHS